MRVIDLSMYVSPETWRGSWKVRFYCHEGPRYRHLGQKVHDEWAGKKLHSQGSAVSMSLHTATHIDAPLHVVAGAKSLNDYPIDYFFGEASVIDLIDKPPRPDPLAAITAEDMEARGKHVRAGDFVLLKTGWPERQAGAKSVEKMEGLPYSWDYWRESPYPTISMAEWMVKKKVKAVCYDGHNDCTGVELIEWGSTHSLKRAPKRDESLVHYVHMTAEPPILHVEYLCNLVSIMKKRVKFFAVPLKLTTPMGLEASPVRAFVIEED